MPDQHWQTSILNQQAHAVEISLDILLHHATLRTAALNCGELDIMVLGDLAGQR